MALKALVTGAIADPVLRWTPQQKAVVEMRVNATASSRDKTTGNWSDMGSPLWVSATFWDEEAKHLSQVLRKGDRVSVEGTLVVETYHRRDGGEGIRYVLRFPRFLGVIPSRRPEPVEDGAYTDTTAPTHASPVGHEGTPPYGQPPATTGSIPITHQGGASPDPREDPYHGAVDNDGSPF